MRVCYFGTYERNYPRNRVVIEGLRKNNVIVTECHVPFWEKVEDKTDMNYRFFLQAPLVYLKLILKYLKRWRSDSLIVGYIGQPDVIIAWLLTRKPIIFNPMTSLYDTVVLDRKMFRKGSIKAKFMHFIDRLSFKLADVVCADTLEHKKYFVEEFNLNPRKVKTLYIGAQEYLFFPRKTKKKNYIKVLFYGKFTPLHGTSFIIKAAKLLEKQKNIKFEIIGTGQTHKEDLKLAKRLKLKNIDFIEWVPYVELPEHIAEADICLGGHFGPGGKAGRVIPNKTYQMMTMKKPIIVSDSEASKEGGFVDKENSVFCKRMDEKAIADSILLLAKNKRLREKIAKNSYDLFKKRYSVIAIGKQMKDIIERIK